MKLNKYKTYILFLLIFTSQNSFSQTTVGELLEGLSEGQYIKNLGFIYGSLRNVKFLREVCAKKHPEFIEQNLVAYSKWILKHNEFHSEIEQLYLVELQEMAYEENKNFEDVNKKIEEMIKTSSQSFANQLIKKTNDDLKSWCKTYPKYTQSEITDIKNYFSQRVEQIYLFLNKQ